tara:strand:+ start:88 stop:885 length:798 start_codon:yes stop_codon:yes gene_type:complete
MKKFLAIMVLGLLMAHNSFAKTIQLDQGVKIKIPNDYEYLQFKQYEFMKANLEGMEMSKSEIDEIIDQMQLYLGMNGTETSTIIGRRGYKNSYGDFTNHMLSGNNPESWSGFSKFSQKCGNKRTEKSMMKCAIDFFKMDPIIQIDVANGINEELKELALALEEANIGDAEDFESFNETTEKVKNTFNDMYQNEIEIKIAKVKNKLWGIEILGKDIMFGFTAKRIGYMFFQNERVFVIQGFCMSKKTCKNIKNLNDKILEPFLSMK